MCANENGILTLIIEHLYFFLSQGNLTHSERLCIEILQLDLKQLLYTVPSSIAHSHSACTALV